jgi:hypothetical protein
MAGQPCGVGVGTCSNELTCALGVCTPIASMPNGNVTNNMLACQTLFAMVDATGLLKCHENPKLTSGSTIPTQCTLGTFCQYKFDSSSEALSLPCKCGANGNGMSYCHPGIANQVKELANFTAVISKSYAAPCHISNPWFCLRRKAETPADYYGAYASHKNLTSPEIYMGNDQCTKMNINKDYWVAYNVVYPVNNSNNTNNTGWQMGTGISIFLVLLIIEISLLI